MQREKASQTDSNPVLSLYAARSDLSKNFRLKIHQICDLIQWPVRCLNGWLVRTVCNPAHTGICVLHSNPGCCPDRHPHYHRPHQMFPIGCCHTTSNPPLSIL